VKPYRARGGVLWRWLFVPLYRRLPWTVKAPGDVRAAHDRLGVNAAAAVTPAHVNCGVEGRRECGFRPNRRSRTRRW
jgi:hypothetical protein